MSMVSRRMVSRTAACSSSVSWSILVYNKIGPNKYVPQAVLVDLKPMGYRIEFLLQIDHMPTMPKWTPPPPILQFLTFLFIPLSISVPEVVNSHTH